MSQYNPPLYGLQGKHALYSRDVLIPVNESKLKLPPTKPNKYIIENIIDKKTIKNRVHYEVKWKGYSETTFEPRTTLLVDVPDLVKEFESGIKKKKKKN